jgi:hypothetical protein
LGRILDFNANLNFASIDEAQRLGVTLRDGWQQIASNKPGAP